MNQPISRQASRQAIAQKIFVGAGLVGLITGFGGALLKDQGVVLPRTLVFGVSLAMVATLFWVSVVYWRNIDEAAREAHKFAWFWGGSAGLLIMAPIGALVSSERLVAVMGERTPAEWVTFGLFSLLAAQLIGYSLAWAGWWLRQR